MTSLIKNLRQNIFCSEFNSKFEVKCGRLRHYVNYVNTAIICGLTDYICYCRNCLGIKWLSSTWLWSRCGPVTASLRRCLANKLNIRCRLVYASDVSNALFTSVSFTIIAIFGCSGLVVEYRTRNREVAGSTHSHPVHCKQP